MSKSQPRELIATWAQGLGQEASLSFLKLVELMECGMRIPHNTPDWMNEDATSTIVPAMYAPKISIQSQSKIDTQ